jgi:hypothetical protein
MVRTKVAGVLTAAAALVGGPLAAAPARAQTADLPCEVFARPYDYPCGAAERTINVAFAEAARAVQFVSDVRDEAGEVVFRVYCLAFPNQPECQ